MFGKVFYHKTFKNYINGFGTLFNDLHIAYYKSDGSMSRKAKVPIQYAGKEQWYTNIMNPSTRDAAQNLPMMSFVRTGLSSLSERRKAQKSEKKMIENPPYAVEAPQDFEMTMRLSIVTGSQIEMDQIIEQILHYFDPSFTVKYVLCKDTINYVHDCPITLTGINESENNWEGELTRRRIIFELDFKFIVKLFGPIYVIPGTDISDLPFDYIEQPKSLGAPIDKVEVDFHSGGTTGEYYTYIDLQNFPRNQRFTIELEDGNLLEVTEDFYDGKIRNIVPLPKDVDSGSL